MRSVESMTHDPPLPRIRLSPTGVHSASLEEIDERFGKQSEIRKIQMESVRWMIALAIRAGVERIILNGSFVTDIIEPNDVDCVLQFTPGTRKNLAAFRELRKGLPFLSIAIAAPKRFRRYVDDTFASDRFLVPKGTVEMIL